MYFVVYRDKEVIDGPFQQVHAEAVAEDLGLLFEDPHYTVRAGETLPELGLRPTCRHHIHEDQPPCLP